VKAKIDAVAKLIRDDVYHGIASIRRAARAEGFRDMAAVWGDVPGIGMAESIQDLRLANRYADRLGQLAIRSLGEPGAIRAIDNRLATIAITENSTAFNAQRQVIAESIAERFDLVEIWDATLDQNTCPDCWGMNGEVAIVGAGFASGFQPGTVHARCRCTSHFERRSYLLH
jgi:hypothetical protein